MAKQWYVLRVASNKEEQVRQALDRKVKIEGLDEKIGRILVPMDRRPRPPARAGGKSSEKKYVERKLYPGYVFIEMELEENGTIGEQVWFLIKDTMGVGDFIGSSSKPVPMTDSDADKMLMQVEKPEDGSVLAVEFKKGQLVKIKEGAFENFDGVVDEVVAEKGLIRVIVTIFGRATPVELEYWQVEKE